jgi:hypothetical protein
MLLAGFAAAAAMLLMTGSSTQSGPQANKLEGIWTASVPGTPFHWTYTFSPTDPSGRKALLHGEFIVPLPSPVPGVDYLSSLFGQGEMTGADTGTVTGMWYGMKNGAQGPEIVYIGISVSEGKFLGPDKLQVQHHMAFYSPTPTGQVTPEDKPFLVYPTVVTSIDQRMSSIPLSALGK